MAEVFNEVASLCTEDLTASGFLVEECTLIRLRGQSACLVWLYGWSSLRSGCVNKLLTVMRYFHWWTHWGEIIWLKHSLRSDYMVKALTEVRRFGYRTEWDQSFGLIIMYSLKSGVWKRAIWGQAFGLNNSLTSGDWANVLTEDRLVNEMLTEVMIFG